VATLDGLGFDLVRVTLPWHELEPAQGTYAWEQTGRLLEALDAAGLTPVVTIWGTPAWANGGRAPNWAPSSGEDLASFAAAAAERFPFVRHWVAWNEPNQRRWLRPTTAAAYASRILGPIYEAIHEVRPAALVAGGATAPRAARGGVSPVDFIRALGRSGARLDAYAHNPHPLSPRESPTSRPCARCRTISVAELGRLVRETGAAFPGARVWLTELGYQTNPPDRRLGVPPALQARYVADALRLARAAPRVDMLVHYLYRDEPQLGRWQSGLESLRGQAKPARQAVLLPLSQIARNGARTAIWGQDRCGTRGGTLVLQRWDGSGWRGVARLRTARDGIVRASVRAGRGDSIRLWDPAERQAGAAVVVL
jgi:hypothetical protein